MANLINTILPGVFGFPSGSADRRLAVRAIAAESQTGEPASGQIRFVRVGNEEGYWYLQNNPTANIYDFDAGSLPSGQRIAILNDLEGLGGGSSTLDALTDTVLDAQTAGNFLVFDGSVWVPSGNFDILDTIDSLSPVDSRPASGNIVPDTTDTYNLGNDTFKWREVVASSGTFGNSTVKVAQNIQVTQDATYQGHSLFIEAGATQPFPVRITRKLGGSTNQGLVRIEQLIGNSGDAVQIKYSGISAAISIDANAPNNNGATGIHISHYAGGDALKINHINNVNTGGSAIDIRNNGTRGSSIEISHSTQQPCITINNGGLAGATGFRLTQTADAAGIDLSQIGDGIGIDIDGSSSNELIFLTQNGNADTLSIDKVGTGVGIPLKIDNDGTGVGIVLNQTGLAKGMEITQTTTDETLRLNQNANADGLVIVKEGTGAGFPIEVLNSGTFAGVFVRSDSTAPCISIQQKGNSVALLIESDASNSHCVEIANRSNAAGIKINQAGAFRGFDLNHTGDFHAFSINTTRSDVIQFNDASNASYVSTMHATRALGRTGSSAFNFCNYEATDGLKMKFRGDGQISADVGGVTTPADYAEYFNTLDPSGIETGYAVQIGSSSGLIEVATSGENVIGFVSAAPAMIADAAWTNWHDRFLKDDFGAHILDDMGGRIENPVYNSGLEYVAREDRPEWVAVGLLGKIWVRSYGELMMPGDQACLGMSGMLVKADANDSPKWMVASSGLNFDVTKGYGTTRILYK